MITRYYSEKLNKYFDSVDSCNAAELEWDKAHAEEEAKKKARAEAAKVVEEAFKTAGDKQKEANEARKAAYEKLKEFCGEYGAYHSTIKNCEVPEFESLFNRFWNNWPF